MMNGKMIVFAVCLTGCFVPAAFGAQIKPSVKVTRVRPQIVYDISKPETSCKNMLLNDPTLRNHQVGGCTVPGDWIGTVTVDCEKKEISFTFGYRKFIVQIANRYEKGTALFDQILKHESTHVSLYQKTTEKFYQSVSRALLMQYERSEQKGKSCYNIEEDVYKLFKKYMELLWKEQKKQNQLIDGEENYKYQGDQVFMAQPPKVECRFGKTKSSFLFQSRTDDAGRIIVEIIFPEKGYSGDGKEGMSMDFCKKIEANLSDVFKIRRKENKKSEEFMREILNLSQKMIREKINESGQYKVRSSNPNTRERKEKE